MEQAQEAIFLESISTTKLEVTMALSRSHQVFAVPSRPLLDRYKP
ncbi:hypothetical protein P367_07455 [Comamonas thiooxydans]|uniref:Uncharacterized protein n=1 Tax=Comamonas thiooxydans TaxID=363952 RepID=A0A0E3BST2_9BURK|nr:hypothetical protein P609_00410 [Comamonas thiooxydans]KGG91581.1 hypothetical protein P369_11540 [Comamonas thiooxydans]KGH00083.1 hypothetical protein P367_07455 [Comamonas thiooxydans]KGH01075.1 hypothetical protein P245_00405 [Comamonas thiooxydans]